MIRNGGKLTKIRYTTSSSNTAGATGIYDTFDAYNARLSDLWPVLPTFSSNVTASTSTIYHNGSGVTITNTSKNITANTTLYYTIETVSGPSGSFVGIGFYNNQQYGTITQPAGVTGIANIYIYPLADQEPDPTRQPVQFKVNIRTTSYTGPIVGSSPVITIPTPIPTLQFLPSLNSYTQFDETQSGWYLSLTWANIGTANTVSQINYNITYSGTATTQDLLTTVATMSTVLNSVSYNATSAYIYGKKDYLTEGTESLTMTVTGPSYGWTIGTVSANIIDTSITPVTTITPSKTAVEKGTTIRFDVAIQNAQETTIYYVITGSAASKFSAQTGSFLLSAGGITLTVINNFNYSEADTTFQVQFRAQSTSGYLYGTSQVITVTSPAQPSASIVAIASMDEGTTNSFVVNTTNYSGNLDWKIQEIKSGSVLTTPVPTDFLNATSGTITVVNGGSGTIAVKPRADTFTEGSETFRLTVSLPSGGGTLSTSDFTINDTSTGTTELLDLYSFLSFKFLSGADDINYVYGTTANKTGDSLSTLLSKYNTTTYPWLNNTSYYNVVTAGIQLWTVPFTGVYRFKVAGARGGGWYYATIPGGWGATLNGDVFLTRGTVLSIVVGKAGSSSTATGSGGGGGGGTFVYTGSIGGTGLLFAAGGGGGSDDDGATAGQNAREDLCAGLNATSVRPDPTNGQGAAPAGGGGGSGTGWLSDSTSTSAGTRFLGGDAISPSGCGGFGGGGGDIDDGGGGGGYTGGTSSTLQAGGCGGSYYNPQSVNNYSWGGTNQVDRIANGFVEITAITTGATAVITPSSSTVTEGQNVTFNIVTTGFITGTLYYYLLTNTGSISTTEFSNTTNTLAGSVTITDSTGQVTYTYKNDTYTEGSEAVSLLVYYNTGGIRYTMGTSSQVTISDSSTGSAAQFTRTDFIQFISGTLYYEVRSPSASGATNLGALGWTILRDTTTATADSYFSVPLTFTFKINNTNFTDVIVNENGWIVFGTTGETLSAGFISSTAASAIPRNKFVFSGGGNNSMQRLFYRVDGQNRFVIIRYEGNSSTSGTQGSPGIIAEIKLFNPQFTGGISIIELNFQTSRATGTHPISISNSSAYFTTRTYSSANVQYSTVFYADNAEATSWSALGMTYSGDNYGVIL